MCVCACGGGARARGYRGVKKEERRERKNKPLPAHSISRCVFFFWSCSTPRATPSRPLPRPPDPPQGQTVRGRTWTGRCARVDATQQGPGRRPTACLPWSRESERRSLPRASHRVALPASAWFGPHAHAAAGSPGTSVSLSRREAGWTAASQHAAPSRSGAGGEAIARRRHRRSAT